MIRCAVGLSALSLLSGCDSLWGSYVDRSAYPCTPEMVKCMASPSPQTCPDPSLVDEAQRFCGKVMRIEQLIVDPRRPADADILFVIDNSAAMASKQRELMLQMSSFFQRLASDGINYHIGVTSTDIGFLPSPTASFPGPPTAGCQTFSGDDGALQNIPCSSRTTVSTEASTLCKGGLVSGAAVQALCPDPSFVPASNARYIDVNVSANMRNTKSLIVNGIDQGPLRTFQCMGLLGDAGCGVESPLEAAKRALDGHMFTNIGFLRSGSLLAVIWVTDEDDCSVPLARRTENDPSTTTTFTSGGMTYQCSTTDARTNANPSGVDVAASCYALDYRCLARSLTCDQPLNTAGLKTNCTLRTDSYLASIDLYVKFFSALRSPDRLVLAGLWPPSVLTNPSGIPVLDGKVIIRPESAGSGVAALNRGYRTEASCYNQSPSISYSSDMLKGYIGQAQVRLSTFLRSFPADQRIESSICDINGYASTLDRIATKIGQKATASCLGGVPQQGTDGRDNCLVGYVDANYTNATPDVLLPQCGATCCSAWGNAERLTTKDPAIIAACQSEPADCYCASPNSKVCSGNAAVGIWSRSGATPPGKVVSVRCALR